MNSDDRDKNDLRSRAQTSLPPNLANEAPTAEKKPSVSYQLQKKTCRLPTAEKNPPSCYLQKNRWQLPNVEKKPLTVDSRKGTNAQLTIS